jgi:hypothetical protein
MMREIFEDIHLEQSFWKFSRKEAAEHVLPELLPGS